MWVAAGCALFFGAVLATVILIDAIDRLGFTYVATMGVFATLGVVALAGLAWLERDR